MIHMFVPLLGAPHRSWGNYVMQNINISTCYTDIMTSGKNLKPMTSPAYLLITKTFQKSHHELFFDIVKLHSLTQFPHLVNARL
jgi:hypothetical protein